MARRHSVHKKKSTQKKLPRRQGRRSLQYILITFVWIVIIATLGLLWYSRDLPNLDKLHIATRHPIIEMVDCHGQHLITLGDVHEPVSMFQELPSHLIEALIAIEDRRFYQHHGIDFIGIIRACYQNIRYRGTREGASTLTQQLAKNLFLSADRSLKRKIQEIIIALWLERNLNKQQILALYLNRVYFGAGCYGINAAAKFYFHKNAKILNLHEAAMLIGLLKAPTRFSPLADPEKSMRRAEVVLNAMCEAGFLPQHFIIKVSSMNHVVMPKGSYASIRYFADWIREQIQFLPHIPNVDLRIETTLDLSMQAYAEKILTQKLSEKESYEALQGSLLCLGANSAVKAMIGGRSYWQSPFNRTTQSYRQAGSTFKLFVYLAALEQGYLPETRISDVPIKIGKWLPHNYRWQSQGEITVREAFAYSVNTATVRLAQKVGYKMIQHMARKMGITSQMPNDLTLALGSASVTMLELANAYHTVLQQGHYSKPFGIVRIRDRQTGKIIYNHQSHPKAELSSKHVHAIQDMLRAVMTRGTGRHAYCPELWQIGKTGTTQNYRDAWMIGMAGLASRPACTTLVWIGRDDAKPMDKITGSTLPSLIWRDFMRSIYPVSQERVSHDKHIVSYRNR